MSFSLDKNILFQASENLMVNGGKAGGLAMLSPGLNTQVSFLWNAGKLHGMGTQDKSTHFWQLKGELKGESLCPAPLVLVRIRCKSFIST